MKIVPFVDLEENDFKPVELAINAALVNTPHDIRDVVQRTLSAEIRRSMQNRVNEAFTLGLRWAGRGSQMHYPS